MEKSFEDQTIKRVETEAGSIKDVEMKNGEVVNGESVGSLDEKESEQKEIVLTEEQEEKEGRNFVKLVMDGCLDFTTEVENKDFSLSKESKLTLIFLTPLFFKVSINLSTITALVVIESSTGKDDNFSKIIGISFLIRGSPPVKRIFVTPFSTKVFAIS